MAVVAEAERARPGAREPGLKIGGKEREWVGLGE